MPAKTVDLVPATTEVARVVQAVRDDQLNDPTPCEDTTVAAMLDHLVGLTEAFRLAAEKRPLPGPPSSDAGHLVEDWRTRLPQQLDALAVAWQHPAATEGMAEAGGARLPAAAMSLVALNEVLVHGWDVAVATGQEYRPDPVAAERCLAFARDFVANTPDMRNGMYGPVVPVPDDAPAFDQLLGETGRDPGWTRETELAW